jgi:hypothetical protein
LVWPAGVVEERVDWKVRYLAYLACVEGEIKTTTHEQLVEMAYIWSTRFYLLLLVSNAMAYVVNE